MDINILMNPILLSIVAFALTYLYLWWEDKKLKEKDPKAQSNISILKPAIVGIITLFITYNILGIDSCRLNFLGIGTGTGAGNNTNVSNPINIDVQTGGGVNHITDVVTDTFGSNTYRLIGKNNIKLPQTDVFIDIARF